MNKDVIEIKIRVLDDVTRWEEIPVCFTTKELSSYDVEQLLDWLKQWASNDMISVIRWNRQGDIQGHYILNRSFTNNFVDTFGSGE